MTTADSVDSEHVRYVADHLAVSVTVVGSAGKHGPMAQTVVAVLPVLSDPAIMAAGLENESGTGKAIAESGSFAVSVLPARRPDIANFYAERIDGAYLMGSYAWRPADSGSPVLSEAMAWFDCEVTAVHEVGSHRMFVGVVRACGVNAPNEDPLTWFRRAYRALGGYAAHDGRTYGDIE